MKMTNSDYGAFAKKHSPRSPLVKDLAAAFIIGGLICCIGQAIHGGWSAAGFSEEDASALTSITLIFAASLCTGLGVYDDLARLAGAGTLVPVTGFSNSVTAPALEFKSED